MPTVRTFRRRTAAIFSLVAVLALSFGVACSSDDDGPSAAGDPTAEGDPTASGSVTGDAGSLTVYSGRSQDLVGPLLEQFEADTGIQVNVRYADTAQLAATILEEGSRSPADVFFAQDAGALGAVEGAGLLTAIDASVLERVPERYRSPHGEWVGVSGRVRTVVYNTEVLTPDDLPASILDFTDPRWSGRIGWAPTNGSFQAFVTALRLSEGEDAARAWLEGIKDNGAIEYPNNPAIVAAVAAGEIEVGFVNHYYVHRFIAEEGEDFEARNYYTAPGDVGTLVNVAGVGILGSSDSPSVAVTFVDYLLSESAQEYFSRETFEYPLVPGIEANADLASIEELDPVDVDLGNLADLQGSLTLMSEVGILP
ncbi:MAG: iron ABC transporter substrate-binding protein [Dehalococcoidia bacterium]